MILSAIAKISIGCRWFSWSRCFAGNSGSTVYIDPFYKRSKINIWYMKDLDLPKEDEALFKCLCRRNGAKKEMSTTATFNRTVDDGKSKNL